MHWKFSDNIVVAQVQHGAGRHNGDIPPKDLPIGLMLNYMSQLTYLYGICFCKLAVGASLLRIASTKFWKHLVLGVMIFVFAYTTAGFVVSEISELFHSPLEPCPIPSKPHNCRS